VELVVSSPRSGTRAVDTIRSLNAARRRELGDAEQTARARYDLQLQAWDYMLSDEILKALGGLPVDERRAIELAYFEGHIYVKVAEIPDEPEGTIKSRIRNGMRRMRSELSLSGIQRADQR
jgi:RNA polymerase sigma-70 factor (ECF subfamily)